MKFTFPFVQSSWLTYVRRKLVNLRTQLYSLSNKSWTWQNSLKVVNIIAMIIVERPEYVAYFLQIFHFEGARNMAGRGTLILFNIFLIYLTWKGKLG